MRMLPLFLSILAIFGCTNAGDPYIPEIPIENISYYVVYSDIPEFGQYVANLVIDGVSLSEPILITYETSKVRFLGSLVSDTDIGEVRYSHVLEDEYGYVLIYPVDMFPGSKLHNLFNVISEDTEVTSTFFLEYIGE